MPGFDTVACLCTTTAAVADGVARAIAAFADLSVDGVAAAAGLATASCTPGGSKKSINKRLCKRENHELANKKELKEVTTQLTLGSRNRGSDSTG